MSTALCLGRGARGLALLALALLVSSASSAFGGANPDVTLPLHARFGQAENGCRDFQPVDCVNLRPTVNIPPNTEVMIYLLMHNYSQVQGVQTAFEWDPGWVPLECFLNCRPGSVWGWPDPCYYFEVEGVIGIAFNCVTGPALEPFGRLRFLSGPSGCIRQVQTNYPFGVYVGDCTNGIDQVDPADPVQALRLGRICVEEGGHDACDRVTPVEASTWGRIKAAF